MFHPNNKQLAYIVTEFHVNVDIESSKFIICSKIFMESWVHFFVILQTQYMHFAMEASRKCESTFAAASNVIMEEARKRDCITCIRKVIDFSFQDVDELIRLVWNAAKAISHAGLGGARD